MKTQNNQSAKDTKDLKGEELKTVKGGASIGGGPMQGGLTAMNPGTPTNADPMAMSNPGPVMIDDSPMAVSNGPVLPTR